MKLDNFALAALAEGMAAHNKTVAEALTADTITLTDYCGNVYTLWVWVTKERTAHYLLECRRIPHAEGNIFRAALPADPTAFDTHEDFLAAVAATPSFAKTVKINHA